MSHPVKNEPAEQKYLEKCRELKRRIREIEEYNEAMAVSISRTKRSIQRLRLERSFLLEKLEERTFFKVDDSDGSISPPLSPVGGDKKSEVHLEREESIANPVVSGESSCPKKRVLPPRNPNMPKKPQNAYIIFCEVEKDRVRNELEHIQPGEPFDLTKAMAEAWKDLGPKGRSPFYALYEDDKVRYIKEMAAYSDPNATPTELREKQRAIKALRELERKEKLAKEQHDKGIPPMSDGLDGNSEILESDRDTYNYDHDHGSDTEPPSSMGVEPEEL